MLVFFACMIEQKQFRDGFRRSMELLKGRSLRAVVLLLVMNFGLAAGLVLMYVVIVVVSAVIVTLFVDSYAAMAVLAAVCARLEAGGPVHWRDIGSPGGLWGSDRDILPVWNEKRACSALGFYHAL